MEATIIFKDKTEITAEVNGSCLITNKNPDFPMDLSEVTVKCNEQDHVLKSVEIIECASVDNRYWFSLFETPQAQIEKEKSDAQIMYTALMTDTLLKEG